ncbi:ribonuclease III [Bowdeniella nasicola]|uniref:Ribonuclease 3 n=1 Tax=Bowdeniella nasicola TaxID=208480 RepID=A0A1Q5Q4N9_9ACTO|nr:ribonuclease III [Bowdeniella nasicola]OKL54659.1 ribonuclease III [Bowdeniella nasicola]
MSPTPPAILDHLGVTIPDELLVLALTHRSFAHEAGGMPDNERLEFLGDAVLDIIVTDYLYHKYPDHSEAELSMLRAGVISQESLAQVAREINLGGFLLLGKGELKTGGNDRDSILSDTVEALIGATYLTHGLEVTRAMVMRLIQFQLQQVVSGRQGVDWRTQLMLRAAELGLDEPTYTVESSGPDHDRRYHATVTVGHVFGQAAATSKRVALRDASAEAMAKLGDA